MNPVTNQELSSLLPVVHRFDGTVERPPAHAFNFMHWNINHLKNKTSALENNVFGFPGTIHVCAIGETCITTQDPTPLSLYDLPNYSAFHNRRNTPNPGGGVSLYVHDVISDPAPTVLVDLVTEQLDHFLVLNIPRIDVNVAVVYRRPAGNVGNFLHNLCESVLEIPNCVIMGDTNLNLLDRGECSAYFEHLATSGHVLLNSQSPDAFTRPVSGKILDHALTNRMQSAYSLSIVHDDISDHSILYGSATRVCPDLRRSLVKRTLDIRTATETVNQLFSDGSISNDLNSLNKDLESIVLANTREKIMRSNLKPRKAYMTTELVAAIRERNRLCALKHAHRNDPILHRLYDEKRKLVDAAKKSNLSHHWKNEFDKATGDSRKTWRLFKEVLFNQKDHEDVTMISMNGTQLSNST